jgi:hypothetical protein
MTDWRNSYYVREPVAHSQFKMGKDGCMFKVKKKKGSKSKRKKTALKKKIAFGIGKVAWEVYKAKRRM